MYKKDDWYHQYGNTIGNNCAGHSHNLIDNFGGFDDFLHYSVCDDVFFQFKFFGWAKSWQNEDGTTKCPNFHLWVKLHKVGMTNDKCFSDQFLISWPLAFHFPQIFARGQFLWWAALISFHRLSGTQRSRSGPMWDHPPRKFLANLVGHRWTEMESKTRLKMRFFTSKTFFFLIFKTTWG